MTIEDCFFRTKDDCLAFKGNDGYGMRNCENITVSRTCLWSDECCAVLLGDESRARAMRNITIKDSHVLYLSFEGYPKKFLMLHSGERMRMENIRLENIDIHGEGQNRNLVEMSCEFNQYSKEKSPGSISNILLKNVNVTGKVGPYRILMQGFDKQYGIDGVAFENFTVNGNPITEQSPNLQIGKFSNNITFK